jgi:hypothetical protein
MADTGCAGQPPALALESQDCPIAPISEVVIADDSGVPLKAILSAYPGEDTPDCEESLEDVALQTQHLHDSQPTE